MNLKTTAYIELTLAMMIVGSLSVVGKKVIEIFPVMLSSVLTLSMAAVGMTAIHLIIVGRLPVLNWPQFKYLFLQTLFGVVLFRVFFLYGLYWSSASMAGILIALTPVVIALLSIVMLREKVGVVVSTGIGLCVVGVALCQSSEIMMSNNWQALIGIGLVLLAVVCEALFTVLRKKLTHQALNPVTSNVYLCVIGAVLFLPLGLYDLRSFDLSSVQASDWLLIVYTAVFVNIISFVLWFRGVDKVDATTAGVFTVVMPVTALILSSALLGEVITVPMIGGIMVVIAGLIFVITPVQTLQSAANRVRNPFGKQSIKGGDV